MKLALQIYFLFVILKQDLWITLKNPNRKKRKDKDMKKGVIITLLIVVILIVIGAVLGGSYNGLVTKSEDVESKLGDLDVQLQRRADLIPNLVNTVKGYAKQEQDVINSVTEARARLSGAGTIEEKSEANTQLSGALNRLLLVVENYPELKSNQNFMQLSDELAGTENRITVARRDYNNAVKDYNLKIKRFPSNLMASMFGFDQKGYFEAKEGSEDVPNVNFGE